jgi:hypothetical protein
MSTAQPPPSDTKQQVITVPSWVGGMGVATVVMGIVSFLLFIFFHTGAAYLSYQKYQSGLWAFLDFFFPYFYYPYYAFFLASQPAPTSSFLGGMRKMMKKW